MNKIIVKIGIIIFGIVIIILAGSFVTRFFKSSPPEITTPDGEKIHKVSGIQINILNGTDVPGIADKARYFLRNYGFDVVEIDNTNEPYKQSVVIDRSGDSKTAKLTAMIIGIDSSRIILKKDSSLYLRASVILGNDYKTLVPFN